MKKFIAVTLTLSLILAFAACGKKTCDFDGCDEPVYQIYDGKGYCEEHYAFYQLSGMFNGSLNK